MNNELESLRQQLASLEQEVEQCCYGESLAFAAMRQQLDGWIAANSPNGWIDNLRQQLADSQKQVVILRDVMHMVSLGHKDSTTSMPEKYWEAVKLIREALATTEPKP